MQGSLLGCLQQTPARPSYALARQLQCQAQLTNTRGGSYAYLCARATGNDAILQRLVVCESWGHISQGGRQAGRLIVELLCQARGVVGQCDEAQRVQLGLRRGLVGQEEAELDAGGVQKCHGHAILFWRLVGQTLYVVHCRLYSSFILSGERLAPYMMLLCVRAFAET